MPEKDHSVYLDQMELILSSEAYVALAEPQERVEFLLSLIDVMYSEVESIEEELENVSDN